jgi:hypothetical protein
MYNSNKCYTILSWRQPNIDLPNDGVLTVKSQVDYPNAIRYVPMNTSNHFQERRTDETKAALNALFNGDYGGQFHLNEK